MVDCHYKKYVIQIIATLKEFILLFLKTLGRSDVENQTKEISSFLQRFNEKKEETEKEFKKYGSLSLKLSVVAGLFFTILLV